MINKLKPHFLFYCLIVLFACGNPYKGFKGVETKGMKKKKPPSQQLKDDYDKASRKMVRAYKKEQKKTKKRLGSEIKE